MNDDEMQIYKILIMEEYVKDTFEWKGIKPTREKVAIAIKIMDNALLKAIEDGLF